MQEHLQRKHQACQCRRKCQRHTHFGLRPKHPPARSAYKRQIGYRRLHHKAALRAFGLLTISSTCAGSSFLCSTGLWFCVAVRRTDWLRFKWIGFDLFRFGLLGFDLLGFRLFYLDAIACHKRRLAGFILLALG